MAPGLKHTLQGVPTVRAGTGHRVSLTHWANAPLASPLSGLALSTGSESEVGLDPSLHV